MRRKLLFLILAALATVALASCDFNSTQHNHSFSRAWTVTEDEHWREANCGHELISSKGVHEWDNGKETKSPTEKEDGEFTYTCKICKHTKKSAIEKIPHEHSFGGEYVSNRNYHWQKATCEHSDLTSPAESHRYNGNECFVCGYLKDSIGLDFVKYGDEAYAVSGKGSCLDSKIVIPDYYDGAPVVAIASGAFESSSITKIILPTSIVDIKPRAFNGCSFLKEILWKEGELKLQTIGSNAFVGAEIKSFSIPATVTSIGNNAFYSCDSIIDFTVEEGNTSYKAENGALYTADGKELLQYALANPSTSFTVPNTVTVISDGAFAYSCYLKEIVFEEGSLLKKIPSNAFYFLKTLESINIPSTINYVGDYAFYNCEKVGELAIPSSVTYIGSHAFHGCHSMAPFDIPASATTIGEYAFANCEQFVTLNIPQKVSSVGDFAFMGCIKLQTVSIPASLGRFGKRVFMGCEALTNISVAKDNPTLSSIDGNLYNKAGTDLVYYCVGKPNEEFIVPQGVTSLYAYSVYSAKNLKKVVLPDNFKKICTEAFSNCYALEEIVLPDSVDTIEGSAFLDCSSLKSFDIPASLTTLTTNMFKGCKSLTEITIPANITTIQPLIFATNDTLKRAVFEVTEGWHYLSSLEGAEYLPFDSADIADPEKAAIFLTTPGYNHFNHTWKLNP